MIRGTLTWLAFGAGLLHAAIGDWQAWTYTQSPAMAAVSGRAVWAATSGGAVSYDTVSGAATVSTNLDGLVSTNLVGILSLGDTLWTTSADGDLCRLLPGGKTWQSFGSYRESGWTFNPRVIASAHGLLFVGGDQGLSVFSTSANIALDNMSSFGSLSNQKIHAVVVERDTIWVGLDAGAAYAVPSDWTQIGRGRNILSDPSKWTVFQTAVGTVTGFVRWSPTDFMHTVPDTGSTTIYDTAKTTTYDTTIKIDTSTSYTPIYDTAGNFISSVPSYAYDTTDIVDTISTNTLPLSIDTVHKAGQTDLKWNWSLPNGGNPLICTGWDLYWNGKSWSIGGGAGPVHAVPYAGGMALCFAGRGLMLLSPDGTLKAPKQQPPHLPDSLVHHVSLASGDSLYAWIGNGIYALSKSRQTWSSSLASLDDYNYALSLPTMARDPAGSLLVGDWGWGVLRLNAADNFVQYTHLNSCLISAVTNDTNYVVATAVSQPSDQGNWVGLYGNPTTNASEFAFLPVGAAPKCYAASLNSASGSSYLPIVNSLALEGDSAIWAATPTGVYRMVPSADSLRIPFSDPSQSNPSSVVWYRNQAVIAVNGNLVYYTWNGKSGWTRTSVSTTQLQNRGYKQLEVDSLGNLWAGGTSGLDIIDSNFNLSQPLNQTNGLLNDNIYHFSLNRANGTVAIATAYGLDIYQSKFIKASTGLDPHLVPPFPNPFRKLQNTKVAFPNVNSNCELYIFASDGTLINHQGGSAVVGNQFLWTPKSNIRPGVYFWSLSQGSTRVTGRLVIGD
jgi:hypothetical protein